MLSLLLIPKTSSISRKFSMLIFEDIIVAYLCKDYLNFLSNIQFGIFYSLHENDIPL